MDQRQLREYLDNLLDELNQESRQLVEARLQGLISVFPFNEYEYILMFLLDRGIISFGVYEKLRQDYVSANRYLNFFELAPRIFGEIWAHQHLMDLDPRIHKPDKSLDPEYEGQYDLWIEEVRVEVKAGRAYNRKKRDNLVSKALRYGSADPFWMNFQQLKLDICDVFIFIGVWTDLILYWVLSNDDVKENPFRSHQHRGGIEYQIGITDKNIKAFDQYRVGSTRVADVLMEKGS